MRRHHEVPTHLNVEDKVLFGLTVRQFLYMLVGTSATYTLWEQLAGLGDFVRVAIGTLCVVLTLAFALLRPADRPLEEWLRPHSPTRYQCDARPGSRWSRRFAIGGRTLAAGRIGSEPCVGRRRR